MVQLAREQLDNLCVETTIDGNVFSQLGTALTFTVAPSAGASVCGIWQAYRDNANRVWWADETSCRLFFQDAVVLVESF